MAEGCAPEVDLGPDVAHNLLAPMFPQMVATAGVGPRTSQPRNFDLGSFRILRSGVGTMEN